jgi:hypothetical protein
MITKAAYVAKNYLGLDWYLIPSESPWIVQISPLLSRVLS